MCRSLSRAKSNHRIIIQMKFEIALRHALPFSADMGEANATVEKHMESHIKAMWRLPGGGYTVMRGPTLASAE